jgi:hypothetical protein
MAIPAAMLVSRGERSYTNKTEHKLCHCPERPFRVVWYYPQNSILHDEIYGAQLIGSQGISMLVAKQQDGKSETPLPFQRTNREVHRCWGRRIRTLTNRSRACRATITQSPIRTKNIMV